MDVLRKSSIWFIVLGALSAIGGLLSLINPPLGTLVVVVWTAWTFLAVGVLQIIASFNLREWSGFLVALAIGVIAVLIGIVLLSNPLAGAVSLSVVIAVLLLISGAAKAVMAFNIKPLDGWIWLLLSGIVSIILAIMILGNFPQSAEILLGVLLGVELLFTGVAMVATGVMLRRA